MLERFNFLFPVWALILSAFAFYLPTTFIQLKPSITYLLALVMLGMGITLKPNDFIRLGSLKIIICVGLLLQFSVMPFAAWIISHSFNLSIPLLTGMLLVGACPGGTASNVICYLAHGNVALSIALTCFSTMLAVVLTPVLTWIYIGHSVEVPVLNMVLTVLKVVVLPIAIGVAVNYWYGKKIKAVIQIFPSISIIAICIIIAIIVAINQSKLQSIAALVLLAIILHNVIGLASGYIVSYVLGYDKKTSRTLAIEVGMQNSGLAVALATEYFKPLAAVPGAIFSIWHNLSGSLLASVWSRKPKKEQWITGRRK